MHPTILILWPFLFELDLPSTIRLEDSGLRTKGFLYKSYHRTLIIKYKSRNVIVNCQLALCKIVHATSLRIHSREKSRARPIKDIIYET